MHITCGHDSRFALLRGVGGRHRDRLWRLSYSDPSHQAAAGAGTGGHSLVGGQGGGSHAGVGGTANAAGGTAGSANTGGTNVSGAGGTTGFAGTNARAAKWASARFSGGMPNPDGVLLRVDFDATPLGNYTLAQAGMDWRRQPPWENGLKEGRASVIEGADAFSGRSLRATYPANTIGPTDGGVQFIVPLGNSYQDLYVAYRVRFSPGFEFSKVASSPASAAAGSNNTGFQKPTGTDGWSGRMMWREQGAAIQYVYHPDQPDTQGEDFFWSKGGQREFKAGKWHRVEHHVVITRRASPTERLRVGSTESWPSNIPDFVFATSSGSGLTPSISAPSAAAARTIGRRVRPATPITTSS